MSKGFRGALKVRVSSEFKNVMVGGYKKVFGGWEAFVLDGEEGFRCGVTTKKGVAGAVVRNRRRRQGREVLRKVFSIWEQRLEQSKVQKGLVVLLRWRGLGSDKVSRTDLCEASKFLCLRVGK